MSPSRLALAAFLTLTAFAPAEDLPPDIQRAIDVFAKEKKRDDTLERALVVLIRRGFFEKYAAATRAAARTQDPDETRHLLGWLVPRMKEIGAEGLNTSMRYCTVEDPQPDPTRPHIWVSKVTSTRHGDKVGRYQIRVLVDTRTREGRHETIWE
jgi:hypothetical protein